MKNHQNLIGDHNARVNRKYEKEQLVLRFLRQHIWSNQEILQEVMGLQSRQAAHKSLVNMEAIGYLKRHSYDGLGGEVTVWGITYRGQAMAFDVATETIITPYFEPNRISEQTIRHELDLQRLRLVAESGGWKNWQDGNRLEIHDKNQKRPDAITQSPEGRIVAIECERTFKSIKRYEQILIQYLRWLKTGKIDEAVWVCPSADMSQRLKVILTSFSDVRIQGQQVMIEPVRHHTHLHFCSYQDWPNYG